MWGPATRSVGCIPSTWSRPPPRDRCKADCAYSRLQRVSRETLTWRCQSGAHMLGIGAAPSSYLAMTALFGYDRAGAGDQAGHMEGYARAVTAVTSAHLLGPNVVNYYF